MPLDIESVSRAEPPELPLPRLKVLLGGLFSIFYIYKFVINILRAIFS
jgi:hypothetical protein